MVTKDRPSGFIALVILGGLALAVVLVVFLDAVPALLVSVFLACSVATLLYGILGGVSEAGFDLGRIKMGGSAAVLIGGTWLFNSLLDPQLENIRRDRSRAQFNFETLASPADDWFAIHERTGLPVEVEFTNPVTREVFKVVPGPTAASLPLKLTSDEGSDRYLVLGTAASAVQAIGYVNARDLTSAMNSIGWRPGTVYGFQRLHLSSEDELPQGMVQRWGNTVCRGASMPFEIVVVRFAGFTDYDLRQCDAAERDAPDYSSSLDNHSGELVQLMIEGQRRTFLVGIVAADHRPNSNEPPWSTFFVIEMVSVPA